MANVGASESGERNASGTGTGTGTDENRNIVAGDPVHVSPNGIDETKLPIDPDDPKEGNEDDGHVTGTGDDGNAGEDSVTKPLVTRNYGYPGLSKILADDGSSSEPRSSRFKDVVVRQMWGQHKRMTLFVLFLFVVIVTGLVVIYHLHREDLYHIYHAHNVTLHKSELRVQFRNPSGQVVLSGTLWKNSAPRGRPYDCSEDGHRESDARKSLCLLWREVRRLDIDHFETDDVICSRIRWHFLSPEASDNSDCFELGEGVRWFGAGILKSANGTLETASVPRQAFVTGSLHDPGAFGPVVERIFLSSRGAAIVVEANSSLELSINEHDATLDSADEQLCLHTRSPIANDQFVYLVCTGTSIAPVRTEVLSLLVPNQDFRVPPVDIFTSLVWSTWAYFKENYNQTSITNFGAQIMKKYEAGNLLMIDDGWENEIGDLEFVTSKFTNPRAMVDDLHSKNLRVSLAFRAQVGTKSTAFQNTTVQRHLVTSLGGNAPGLARRWTGPHEPKWDRGLTGAYDLTDDEAARMLTERLVRLERTYGIDAFHVGGTEISSLPVTRFTVADPNEYTRSGVEIASNLGNLSSSEAAARSQDLSTMIRLKGGTSTWNGVGGLGSVIPSALTLGLLGYPLFIPESVGGSAFDGFPTKELFLRWFEVSAFLPIIHLSVPPWIYDRETEQTVEKLLEVRKNLVLPTIQSVISASSDLIRSPIVRPIWWLDPTDGDALGVFTEFLVGNDVLVAPVLDEGQGQRDIYLPRGLWYDPSLGVNCSGPRWLRGYAVNLTSVAYFIRQ